MSKRDPRIDPRQGDLLRIGGMYLGEYHTVLDHNPRTATSDVSSVCDGRETARSISQWREFFQDAAVILRGDAE